MPCWTFISDIHIKNPGDERERLFFDFLEHSIDLGAEKIFLLGDIFDLMVGEKKEYLEQYENFFNKLNNLQHIHFYYFEGNHDFHLENILTNKKNLSFYRAGLRLEFKKQKIWVSHGDDIEIDNWSYKIYTKLIRSSFIRLLARDFISFSWIIYIGKRMSIASRKRSEDKYKKEIYSNTSIKEKFRKSASIIADLENVDLVVCGHSHFKDFVQLENCIYSNNGYFPFTKTFTVLNDEKGLYHEFINPS